MAPTAHMATTTLRVEGMTCGACTSAVESGFKNVEGAGSVSVSLVMERAVVQHDPNILSAEQAKEIIEDRGFDAEILATDLPFSAQEDLLGGSIRDGEDLGKPQTSITTLAVEGMTCGACTSAVEGGFKDVPGIKSFSISLLSERAVIEHDPITISPENIAEIIEDRGFGATVLDTHETTSEMSNIKSRERPDETKIDLMTTTVAIGGMTCGACTSAVEGGFKDAAGVVQFNISLLAERAVIVHDRSKLSSEQIIEIIEDRGFDAEILSSHRGTNERSPTVSTNQLKIFGLPDSTSATSLERALLQLPGVKSAIIGPPTPSSRARISHDPSMTGLRAVVEAIEKLGYNALVAESDDNNAQLESLAKTREIQDWRRNFLYSLSFAIPVFLITMVIPMFFPRYDFGSFALFIPGLYLGDVLALVLTIPVQFGIGKRFYISAYKSLKHRSPTMDVLVVLGTSAAFFFSVAAMLVSIISPSHTRPSTVFDTSTMLITFITLGRYLENRAKGQTSRALSRLMSLAPSMATIYADPIAAEKAAEDWDVAVSLSSKEKEPSADGRAGNAVEEKVIPTELIEVGDIVILRPGDKIPADGTVTHGQSYVDESMVTGEAMPIMKQKHSLLMAGTVNGAGRVDFRVTRAGRDTQLSQIVKLVQEAQTSRAPIQRMADIVAGYFVPTIIALGLLTFITWMVLSHVLPHPPMVFLKPNSGGRLMVCVKLCISVIVFACPCALGLSTPTAVMVGTGVGAMNGILVKGGAALETATKVTHAVLDKTGTLTMGKMTISETKLEPLWEANEWRRRLWWTIIGLAEMGSEHPVGKAILNTAKTELGIGSEGMIDGSVGDFEFTVGKGVSASVEPATSAERKRYRVLVGNASYLSSRGITIPTDVLSTSPTSTQNPSKAPLAGTTQIYTAIDSTYTGTLSLSDTIKPTARATILALHRMNITTSLVTGDQLPTALAIASMVGIPKSNIHAGVSPHQKQAIIKDLQSTGQIVAMVGDGINDSPALATADIGIALSSGTDVAMEAADIVIMRPDDLLNVAVSLSLARTIFNRIKLNLLWACVYNLIGLPFAMGFGLVWPGGVMLPPMAAGAAMAASSVSVVGSSLLLKFWKRPAWMSVERLEGRGAGGAVGKGNGVMIGDEGDEDGLGIMREAGMEDGVRGRGFGVRSMVLERVKTLFGRKGRRRVDDGYVPLRDVEAV
ncbi:hypothetical protein MMC24_001481 [Lignoscripta atroalba]|nr:hypothetical protein [Lignoscripta atroalba]